MDDLALLRSFADEGSVPPDAQAFALGQLRAAIEAEVARPPRFTAIRDVLRSPMELRLLPRLQAGLAALIAVVIAATAIGALTPSPAVARLNNLARAAERAPVVEIASDTFAYSVTEETGVIVFSEAPNPTDALAVQVTTVTETWLARDGSLVTRRTSSDGIPLSPQAADALTAEVADILGLGQTVEQTSGPQDAVLGLARWPTTVAELDVALRQEAAKTAVDAPIEATVLGLAADLLRNRVATPELRSAVLRVIAELPGVAVDHVVAAPGEVVFVLEYRRDGMRFRDSLRFLEESAFLIHESRVRFVDFAGPGVPRGMVLAERTHSPVEIVQGID